MKMGDLSAFFASKLKDLKFRQWDTPFTFNNIPSNIADRSFHITVGQGSSGPADQMVHTFSMPITVRLVFKGYRDPLDAMANGLNEANDVYAALLAPKVRLEQAGLKDIRPINIQPLPYSASNEHNLIVELTFQCILIFKF